MSANLRLVALGAVAGVTALLSILMLVALNAGGEARVGPLALVKLSAGYARPAEKLLASPSPTAPDAARAAALSRSALAEFPFDNSSWLRLAYADRQQHGRLTPQAADLLRRSYELTAADIYTGVWRLSFVLENSQAAPKDVRASAKTEFEILWGDWKQREKLRQMAVAVRNPAGRLSAQLWIARLERAAAS